MRTHAFIAVITLLSFSEILSGQVINDWRVPWVSGQHAEERIQYARLWQGDFVLASVDVESGYQVRHVLYSSSGEKRWEKKVCDFEDWRYENFIGIHRLLSRDILHFSVDGVVHRTNGSFKMCSEEEELSIDGFYSVRISQVFSGDTLVYLKGSARSTTDSSGYNYLIGMDPESRQIVFNRFVKTGIFFDEKTKSYLLTQSDSGRLRLTKYNAQDQKLWDYTYASLRAGSIRLDKHLNVVYFKYTTETDTINESFQYDMTISYIDTNGVLVWSNDDIPAKEFPPRLAIPQGVNIGPFETRSDGSVVLTIAEHGFNNSPYAQVNVINLSLLKFTAQGPLDWSKVIIHDYESTASVSHIFTLSESQTAVAWSWVDGNDAKTYLSSYSELNSAVEYQDFDKDVALFPNPANRDIHINSVKKYSKFDIYNVNGSNILNGQLKQNKIDVSQLTNGVYFLSLYSDKLRTTKRFVKM